MESKPKKKTWQKPQFTILSRGTINSGLNPFAHEGTLDGVGNYIPTMMGAGAPATIAAQFGKNDNGDWYRLTTIVS